MAGPEHDEDEKKMPEGEPLRSSGGSAGFNDDDDDGLLHSSGGTGG